MSTYKGCTDNELIVIITYLLLTLMLLLFIIDIIIAAGAVSLDLLHNASLWITLTVSEVVGTDNQVKSSLPSLLDRRNFTSALFPGDE